MYFVPVIRDQTSYVLGDCDIELAALGGASVEYSMEIEGQGASWQAYTAPINTIAAGGLVFAVTNRGAVVCAGQRE